MPLSPDPLTGLEEIQQRIDALLRERPLQHSLQLFPAAGLAPQSAAPPPGDENLPVLTDIVAYADTPAPTPEPAAHTAQDVEAMAREARELLRLRLKAEIPTLVESSLQIALPTISRAIQEGLETIAQETLREFMAKQTKGAGKKA
ncbi:MAG: hypothetical protein LBO00_01045 [Zoogloeaceae bacterium]|jgi:hypothetical protein|nr:hypothetical protein [Zoogloeaceae bacterium]